MTEKRMEFLATRLGIEKKPVTAKFLSREWTIPAKEASELMLQFHNSHKTDEAFKGLSINYSVCGKQKCVKGADKPGICERPADILVKIVDQNDLEKTIEQLYANVVSCQVYSMHLQSSVSLMNIIETCRLNEGVHSDEIMTKCGLLQTATNGVVEHHKEQYKEEQPSRRAQTEPLRPKKPVKTEHDVEEKETRRPVYVSRKANTNPTTSSSAKVSAEVKKPLYVSRKRQKESSDGTDKEKSNVASHKKAKTTSQTEKKKQDEERKELEKMFREDGFDDDDFGDLDQNEDEDSVEQEPGYKFDDIDLAESDEEKSKNEADQKLGLESEKEAESNADVLRTEESRDEDAVATDSKGEEAKPEVETYVDADGYVVRKVNRKAAKPIQSSTPAKRSFAIDTKSSKGKNANNARKQSNLMSFFKKKE